MEEVKQLCPECGYPSPLPSQCRCAECGTSLRVVLAAERPVDATRLFAILLFTATLGPLSQSWRRTLFFSTSRCNRFARVDWPSKFMSLAGMPRSSLA